MTNCLFFALSLYWRRYKFGRKQRITWRKSHFGRFPHFLYVERHRGKDRVISYKPINPIVRTFPPPIFKGYVCWGD